MRSRDDYQLVYLYRDDQRHHLGPFMVASIAGRASGKGWCTLGPSDGGSRATQTEAIGGEGASKSWGGRK